MSSHALVVASPNTEWAKEIRTGLGGASLFGLWTSAAFVAAFVAWGSFASLAGATVASGYVAAAGQNQRVQHLEGGIIKTILVREGETVTRGQPLFELDPTEALALRNRLEGQIINLRARMARLTAERSGGDALAFDPALQARADLSSQGDLLREQKAEFDARLAHLKQQKLILDQNVAALNDQIMGMEAQQQAVERQLQVVQEEEIRKRTLLEKGLTDRSEYTALLRSEADLLGQLGQAKASVLSARTQITQSREQLARLDTERAETAASELNNVRSQLSDTEEQFRAAQSVLDRIVVRSPSDGIIVKLAFNSVGSVVRPGDTLLELLPTSDELIVEAKIQPRDIDVIHVGQEARLHFSAFHSRTTPSIPATVTYLSADRLLDRENTQPYYIARLRIDHNLPASLTAKQIYPGMPVETYISTGERTFFEYLAKPILDSFTRAFREE